MRCERCGVAAPVLRTCRLRAGAGPAFALCDPCYAALSEAVWIVPGPAICFGTCRSCGYWFSVRELSEVSDGGRRDAPSGICERCVAGSGTP